MEVELNERSTQQPRSTTGEYSGSTEYGNSAIDEVSSDYPPSSLINELRQDNYEDGAEIVPLFAIAEMLELTLRQQESQRKRRESPDNVDDITPQGRCKKLAKDLNNTVPTNTACPWGYSYTYDGNRYPRCIITATCKGSETESCSCPNGSACTTKGLHIVKVLKRTTVDGVSRWEIDSKPKSIRHSCDCSS